ncbi:sigma-70 family RNA polymerase sigma factor [Cellulomonas sp. WB94]|uniref:RNA polymerase sigma factor n=1 Tax=Cellulomonas sp. WB94 TaxID=2173174 RepID=UPI001F5BB294|nr:sigma-70 family RNA polymerase sigma factor [Cellulomonas sp. WB94]
MADVTVDAALTLAFSEEWGRVVATLIRVTGDWALAEECAQDAFEAAAVHWPVDGVPRSPGAWLTTTARNRALDRLRRSTTEARKLREVAMLPLDEPGPTEDDEIPDDRLRLIFTCCHPALAMDARVALALRTLCGLSVEEIGRAFGVTEPAMQKRLVRARGKIRHAGIPYRVPPAHLLPERLTGVLAVLYLMFTEGYAATSGQALLREPVSGEAIRLTRVLMTLMPDEPEALGLLALELLHDSRRTARVDEAGDLVPLEEQDRSRWDADRIAEGLWVLGTAARRDVVGPYQLQAAIAACHATAAASSDTDWHHIARLYGGLARIAPSPYVELGRAIAVAMADGPDAGLVLLDALAATAELDGYHLLPAARADLHRRAGRPVDAAAAYRDALGLVRNDAERRYLTRRLTEVTSGLHP